MLCNIHKAKVYRASGIKSDVNVVSPAANCPTNFSLLLSLRKLFPSSYLPLPAPHAAQLINIPQNGTVSVDDKLSFQIMTFFLILMS